MQCKSSIPFSHFLQWKIPIADQVLLLKPELLETFHSELFSVTERFLQNKRLSLLFLGRFYEMLTTSSTRKALLVGCMLVSMQDLSGINLIL